MKRLIIILTIVATLIGMVFVYFDWDRSVRLRFAYLPDLITMYSMKPKFTDKRVVAVIDCDDAVCTKTLKSILDQSIRLHDIAVQTNHPEKIDKSLKKVVSIHFPGTEFLREKDRDTIVLRLTNGIEYPFDYIETVVERLLRER